MRLGLYNAILHDRSLPEALKVIGDLGLTGIEINTGGFLPAVHVPTFDDILVSDTARDDYLGIFEGTGVEIAGLNATATPCTRSPSSARSTPKTSAAPSAWPSGSGSTAS